MVWSVYAGFVIGQTMNTNHGSHAQTYVYQVDLPPCNTRTVDI